MTVINKVSATAYSCDCGGTMVHKKGTITRVIRGREIRIHNAPYYVCLSCGEIEFDLSSNISSLFAEAYRTGVSDIDFEKIRGI